MENHTKLSIQVSLNGLSFCILDTAANTVIQCENVVFAKQLTPYATLKRLKQLFGEHALEQRQFSEVVAVHRNNLFGFVPRPFFDTDELANYLKFNTKILANDHIAYDEIKPFGLVNVYVPLVNVNNYIYELFGAFTFKHHGTVMVESLLNRHVRGGNNPIRQVRRRHRTETEPTQLSGGEARVRERDVSAGEREALLGEGETRAGEPTQLSKGEARAGEREALLRERDALLGEPDVRAGEREALLGEPDVRAGEREALLKEREARTGERDVRAGQPKYQQEARISTGKEPVCYVYVFERQIDVTIIAQNKLVLYNNFSFVTKEDFLYYLLFTLEQLQLDTSSVEVKFFGDIEEDDDIYELCYRYIRNVAIFAPLAMEYPLTDPGEETIDFTVLNAF